MTLQSLIISKNKMKKTLLNINCHILSNEIRWCFVHNKRTTGYVLDIGQHQNINIYYFNYNYSLRTICCTVWNLMTIHIVLNHSDLRMDTGRTNRHIMYGNSFFNIKMENFKLIIILLNLYLWVLPVCRFGNFFKNYFSNMKLRYNESKLKMISFVWCMNIISTWKC